MDKKTLDYIKTLTKTDKKNLSQKALKTAEEVGELAKVVLPYENAYATTHRFVDRTRILEECADTFLCVMSVAYDLGFSDEEFETMVNHKMKSWADLQAREGRIKYPVPYEIHVTVDMNASLAKKTLEDFKQDCKSLDVKPILLDLHLRDGAVMKDMMTSSTFMGNNREALDEMKRITYGLQQRGYKVVREKIETIPWHPAAPSYKHENPVMPKNCYFESHLAVLCTAEREDQLQKIADAHYAHKSKNAFKKYDDGTYTVMVTLRTYEGAFEPFKEKVEKLRKTLELFEFDVDKEIIEFSIYDSKVSHDAAWLAKE